MTTPATSSRRPMSVVLLALLLASGLPAAAQAQPTATGDESASTADLGTALAADGSYVGAAGVEGTVEAQAWTLVSDLSAGEAPRFAPAGTTVTQATPAWSALGYRIGAVSNGWIQAIAVSGPNVYIGGGFTNLAGIATADYVAVWNGSSWSGLGSNGAGNGALNAYVRTIAVTGGHVYVGGEFTDAGGNGGADYIARWNGSGWFPLGNFCCGFSAINLGVNDIAIFGDSVYVGGSFTDAGGAGGPDLFARYGIACDCWSAVGGLLNLSGWVNAVAVAQNTGVVYVGGWFVNAAGIAAADYVVGWNLTNWFSLGADSSGDGAIDAIVYDIAVNFGDVYVGGQFTDAQSVPAADYVARYTSGYWYALGSSGSGNGVINSNVVGVAFANDVLYVGGDFTNVGGVPEIDHAARFLTTYSTWSSLGSTTGKPSMNSSAVAFAISGSIVYVGGYFTDAGGVYQADRVAARDTATSTWSSLGSSPATDGALTNSVNAVAVSGTNVYVGGSFINAAGIPEADYLARWNGTSWSSVGPLGAYQGALNSTVNALALVGSVLYVGGSFTNAGNVLSADYVARWNGSVWSGLGSFAGNGALNSVVHAIVATPTDVWVGGEFSDAAGIATADRVARWNGSSWSALGSNGAGNGALVTGPVAALARSGGLLYAAGGFLNAGGIATADWIAKWNGSAWSALGSNGAGGSAINSYVATLASHPAGGVYVGGSFSDAGGIGAADYLARWNGSAWAAIGPSGSLNGPVESLAVVGSSVYAGGGFTDVAGVATADYLARWNGSAWKSVGSDGAGNGALNFPAKGLAFTKSHLYAAGSFTNAAGRAVADFVARWGPLTTYIPDGRIRKGSGTYVGNDIYNNDGTGQARSGSGAISATVTFTIVVQNDGNAATAYRLKATGTATSKYQVKYFRNTTDITSAVVGGTYQTSTLAPGETFTVTSQVKVLSTANVGSSVTRLVTISSVADAAFKDAVKFTVSRA